MTQSQITAERAELAVKQAAINQEAWGIEGQIRALEERAEELSSNNNEIIVRRAKLQHFENEMRRAGEWKSET